VINRGGVEMILIAKVDLNSFLDQADFKKHAGLPFEKRILKTCLLEFSGANEVAKILISDSNNAEYWWKDFLELEAVKDDANNTKTTFFAIERTLAQRLKEKHPSDYTYLRNNLIGYFRTHENFSFEEFQRSVFAPTGPMTRIWT
jgi:hypothetical protein